MNHLTKKFLFGVVYVLFLLIFICVSGELITRIFVLSNDSLPVNFLSSKTLIYKMKPSSTGVSIMGIRYYINSHGLRDREFDYKKNDNTYRILVLGGSMVFGHGVNIEDTFCKKLEDSLNRNSKGMKFEVINSGVNGYKTIQQLAFLKEEGLKYKSDLVICIFVSSDATLEPTKGDVVDGMLLEPEAVKMPLFLKRIARHSSFYNFLGYSYRQLKSRRGREHQGNYLDIETDKIWDKYKELPLEMINLCRKNNTKILFVYLPMKEELQEEDVFPRKHLFNLLSTEGVSYLDTLSLFQNENINSLLLPKDPCHLNKKGNALLAEKIYNFLNDKR